MTLAETSNEFVFEVFALIRFHCYLAAGLDAGGVIPFTR
jgi:hypothetical protein